MDRTPAATSNEGVIERTLPHNAEAESSVLGAVLLDTNAFNEALNGFRNDVRDRPEYLEYGRALSGLRQYLKTLRFQTLPYYDALGLHQLSALLKEKTSLLALFRSETPREALEVQWKHFLMYLYRAILLIDTYWPEGDIELRAKLLGLENSCFVRQ